MRKRSFRRRISPRLVLYMAASLAVLVLVVQALMIKQLYNRTDQLGIQDLKATLIDVARNLNTEPAIDPQTGRRFIPAARLVFPAKLDGHLLYRATDGESSLWLIDANNQLRAVTKVRSAPSLTATFNEVATLQMCSRQVVVSFNTPDPNDSTDKLTLKNTKKLKDGRTAYIYQNACPYGAEPLLRSVDQMESL